MNKTTKKIALLGIFSALYVVLSFAMKIPLIAHIQTDFGYIAFGVGCAAIGAPAFIIGVLGCLIVSLLTSGWVPIGWMLGQVAIGIICGLVYKRSKSTLLCIVVTVLAVFVGIGGIKTVVECYLYSIPFAVKIPKNLIASIADCIPMIVGFLVATKTALKKYIVE